jgi:hypothetical protein
VTAGAASGTAAAAAVTTKLDKASADILSVATSGTVRMAGIRVGDLAWGVSGNRTSGKGLALTPTGVIGHNGTKETFSIDAATGEAVFSGKISASAFMSGSYAGYAWPAAGGSGNYLGPEGLLLGSYNDSKYFQVTSAGNVYAPGMKIENGALTISQANVINTLQIAGNAVTAPSSAFTASSIATGAGWVTIQSISVVTSGARVYITSCTGATDAIGYSGDTQISTPSSFRLLRDGTVLMYSDNSSMSLSEQPAAGSYTYTLQASGGSAYNRSLFVIETKR